MKKISIVDYGMGNIMSVARGIEKIGGYPLLSFNESQILESDVLILPGVGAFEHAMNQINKLKLKKPIYDFINSGKPVMGICLGMQLFFSHSHENGFFKGLDCIEGEVVQIPINDEGINKRKIPHFGWNSIETINQDKKLNYNYFDGLSVNDEFYFVHSYMAKPKDKNNIIAKCNYNGLNIVAGVKKNNITGLQFHPEKSGKKGLQILYNFINQ